MCSATPIPPHGRYTPFVLGEASLSRVRHIHGVEQEYLDGVDPHTHASLGMRGHRLYVILVNVSQEAHPRPLQSHRRETV